ncbi:hypothetical protein ACLKA6_001520 [Drosophila palustris]
MRGPNLTGSANHSADMLADAITSACDASMAKVRRGGNPHRPVAWWNDEIAEARTQCHAARRLCQRHRASADHESLTQLFRAKRKAFKNAVKRSKARHFQELCDAADAQPFGLAYKLVMGKLARQPMPTCAAQLSGIVNVLFPPQPPIALPWQFYTPPDNSSRVLTNIEEHAADPFCEHCGQGVVEDAEHSIFMCPLFSEERAQSELGRLNLTPENLVAHMIADEAVWMSISNLVSHIMKELRRRERQRNVAGN